ncbi:hypothetical protein C489_09246 [Natrinema versiforme JCM 10478]|uniref:Uncharacterized protein n=1 Tax=Natrinema versiforme JCM 10478 TaxID=1227496 RepID=L9Y0W4_9EURY|nr:hypothetical protein C489_09246 [Natrinema versiforme JCM 10478]
MLPWELVILTESAIQVFPSCHGLPCFTYNLMHIMLIYKESMLALRFVQPMGTQQILTKCPMLVKIQK